MPLPWLRLIDGVIGATDIVRWVRGRAGTNGVATAQHALESRLAGLVVGALREAFDRDHERLEIERQRFDEERLRAERAMRLELLRQAGDRETGRLRLVAAIAVTCFLGSLLASVRLTDGHTAARVFLGFGWLLLLAALAATFSAQARLGRVLATGADRLTPADATTTPGGRAAQWFVVAGLASIALAALFS